MANSSRTQTGRGLKATSRLFTFRYEKIHSRRTLRLEIHPRTRPKVIAFNLSRYEPTRKYR